MKKYYWIDTGWGCGMVITQIIDSYVDQNIEIITGGAPIFKKLHNKNIYDLPKKI